MPFDRRPSQRRHPARPAGSEPAFIFCRACTLGTLALLLGTAGFAGCASPEEPAPRQRAIIPQAVRDLQGRQQGDDVVLTFTAPSQSVRNQPLAAPPVIEIFRGAAEPGKPPEKNSTKLIYTIPGEMTQSYLENGKIVFRDRIEPGAIVKTPGASTAFIYAVRTQEARNRASAESNRVVARTYAPPESVGEVRAAVAKPAVTLEWAPAAGVPASTGEYRVYRAEVAPGSAAPASANVAAANLIQPLQLLGSVADTRYRDSNFEWGHTYMYVVRRAVQIGPDTVESADSKPAVITPAEIPPPATPQDVEAVVVPAAQQTAAYVSLSWAISPEGSVVSYAVYRSEQEGARGVRLNQDLLGSPTYKDTSAEPGRRYFYSVTAMDGAGQESPPSAAVEAQIPQ
jgi:fibronectin type 3 domain-containing protein